MLVKRDRSNVLLMMAFTNKHFEGFSKGSCCKKKSRHSHVRTYLLVVVAGEKNYPGILFTEQVNTCVPTAGASESHFNGVTTSGAEID